MILSVDEVMRMPEYADAEEADVKAKLDAIECMVRDITHNKFQVRSVRFAAPSDHRSILATTAFLRVGDTIEVSSSEVNDGLYVIKAMSGDTIEVDRELFPVQRNLVTKVEYPASIREGVKNLMRWEATMRDKVGISSETISRHSVTYFDQSAANQEDGYPVALLGFLKPYRKARF